MTHNDARCHCDVRKKLCKKGADDQLRHPQRSPLRRFRPKKEGIVVTVGRRSAAGGRADTRDAPREECGTNGERDGARIAELVRALLGGRVRQLHGRRAAGARLQQRSSIRRRWPQDEAVGPSERRERRASERRQTSRASSNLFLLPVLAANPAFPKKIFACGATKREVLAALGTPPDPSPPSAPKRRRHPGPRRRRAPSTWPPI